MANISIIHGIYANPCKNWFPWMKNELERLGHTVFVSHFPSPPHHNLKNWTEILKGYEKFIDENTIFVAHSLGCVFVLDWLQGLKEGIRATFLISGFVSELGNEKLDKENKSFLEKQKDWKKIKKNCNAVYVLNSDNDPHVPLKRGAELAQHLEVTMEIIKNAGHINEKSGYMQFPLLLERIRSEDKKPNAH